MNGPIINGHKMRPVDTRELARKMPMKESEQIWFIARKEAANCKFNFDIVSPQNLHRINSISAEVQNSLKSSSLQPELGTIFEINNWNVFEFVLHNINQIIKTLIGSSDTVLGERRNKCDIISKTDGPALSGSYSNSSSTTKDRMDGGC